MKKTCFDYKKRRIAHNDEYRPQGNDPCLRCTCVDGQPSRCLSPKCAPPKDCELIEDKCCEFSCKVRNTTVIPTKNLTNDPRHIGANDVRITVRLMCSFLTMLVVLLLILVTLHRLRKRRIHLIMLRRLTALQRLESQIEHDLNSPEAQMYSTDDAINDYFKLRQPPPAYSAATRGECAYTGSPVVADISDDFALPPPADDACAPPAYTESAEGFLSTSNNATPDTGNFETIPEPVPSSSPTTNETVQSVENQRHRSSSRRET